MTLALVEGGSASAAPGVLGNMTALESGRALLLQMIGRRLAARGVRASRPAGSRPGLALAGPGMRAELTVRQRHLMLECEPCPPLDWPGQLAGHLGAAAAAILGAPGRAAPAGDPGYPAPLAEIAGPALRRAGLSVSMNVHADQDSFDVVVMLTVTSTAQPGRGTITTADDAALTWNWPYPAASGPASIAGKAAEALLLLIPPPGPGTTPPGKEAQP